MKLTYWVAVCTDDSTAYSIRTKTKREAVAQRDIDPKGFGPVHKVTVEFVDAFDLAQSCLGEGGGYWEE